MTGSDCPKSFVKTQSSPKQLC